MFLDTKIKITTFLCICQLKDNRLFSEFIVPLFQDQSSYQNEFDLHENERVSYEWFRTKIRFDTETKSNSEMTY